MKKLFALVLALCLFALPALAETAPDAFTSASVNNFYGGIEGDELMNAINSYSGFYIYSCIKLGDIYYLQLGLSPNQTTANVDNGSELVAMYGCLPAEGGTYPTSGARMNLKKVEDEAVLEELKKSAPQGFSPLYYEITLVRPLG